jgi:dipeptidyl aminopeptidase/acylaminoacyl peptidase
MKRSVKDAEKPITPKSGEYSINVEGQNREYILKIPNNYDPNKQYKLIFCIHPWGGDMKQIANQGYYGLEQRSREVLYLSLQMVWKTMVTAWMV